VGLTKHFMHVFRQNLIALNSTPELIHSEARQAVLHLLDALDGGACANVRALSMPGLERIGRLETLAFRLWFLIG
jgi:hypothetical protein